MNKWKALAIFFTLFSLGSLSETYRIFTSNAPDVAANRKELMPMSFIITSLIVGLTIWFWKKSQSKNLY